VSSGVILAAGLSNYTKKQKYLLTKWREAGKISWQNKEGWLHPPHLQRTREEVKNDFPELPFPVVLCRADALRCPRFVIFRMEVL